MYEIFFYFMFVVFVYNQCFFILPKIWTEITGNGEHLLFSPKYSTYV